MASISCARDHPRFKSTCRWSPKMEQYFEFSRKVSSNSACAIFTRCLCTCGLFVCASNFHTFASSPLNMQVALLIRFRIRRVQFVFYPFSINCHNYRLRRENKFPRRHSGCFVFLPAVLIKGKLLCCRHKVRRILIFLNKFPLSLESILSAPIITAL